MTKFNTGNEIGSTDARDLYDNAQNLDELTNNQSERSHKDRLGNDRKTWWGMEQDFQDFLANSGYVGTGTDGAYEDYDADGPLDIEARNEIFTKDGEFYRAKADLDLPYTTTGTWDGDDETRFVSVGDANLRQELGDASQGGDLVSVSTNSGNESLNAALGKRTQVKDVVLKFDSVSDMESYDTTSLNDGQQANVLNGSRYRWDATSEGWVEQTQQLNDGTQTTAKALNHRTIHAITQGALRTIPVSALEDGQSCIIGMTERARTLRWRSGDRSSEVSSDPGEGAWVAPDSDATGASGAWETIVDGYYLAQWWGVTTGDNIDRSSELQAAYSYASPGMLLLPQGEIRMDSKLPLLSGGIIKGHGCSINGSGTKIVYNGSGNTFEIIGNANDPLRGASMRDLYVEISGGGESALYLKGCRECIIEKVLFRNIGTCTDGVKVEAEEDYGVYKNDFVQVQTIGFDNRGFYFDGDITNSGTRRANDNVLDKCRSDANATGFQFRGLEHVDLHGCRGEGNNRGVRVAGESDGTPAIRVNMLGGYLENDTYDIDVDDSSPGGNGGIRVFGTRYSRSKIAGSSSRVRDIIYDFYDA
ncbi:hypothetical protein [Aidingimonas halophila]|uniref:Uncharacterized protein n=1 Tax=Aidingimonas halophila TaxID=574349 RepID=A0A1H2RC50_9GAMM|nr:hypothetical protein [Aidingimonas halophila]GHC19522.1 hypothetical protein GCM10008094_06960 [Aidingimonas halophila]SDW16730.1 hypothetical protein SAMN05443545_101276 [Aidingimonas halophila]